MGFFISFFGCPKLKKVEQTKHYNKLKDYINNNLSDVYQYVKGVYEKI